MEKLVVHPDQSENKNKNMKCAPILIVEDDTLIREVCRDLLEGEGYSVETCANGEEALRALDKYQDPCLILLDMMMPVMNGKEFMKVFLKRPHTIAPIPVYLVSATAKTEEGKEMGCLGFLKKPFNIDALLSIVKAHCKVNEEDKHDAEIKMNLLESAKILPT